MNNVSTKIVKALPTQMVRLAPLQNKVCVNQKNSISIIPISDICYLKSDGNYTTIVLSTGDCILSSVTMGKYANLMKKHGFLRIHHSHIINPRYLTSIRKDLGYSVVLNHEYTLATSRRCKSILMGFIEQYNLD